MQPERGVGRGSSWWGQELNTPSHSPPSLHSLIGVPLGQTQNPKVRETH